MTNFKQSLNLYLAVGFGGMVGALGRYFISVVVHDGGGFAFSTLTANLIGCFLLTFVLNNKKIKAILSPNTFIALTIGMIGSFTSYSIITVEFVNLWSANILMALAYILISVFGGLAFCYAGYKLATRRQVDL